MWNPFVTIPTFSFSTSAYFLLNRRFSRVETEFLSLTISLSSTPFWIRYAAIASASATSSPGPCPPETIIFVPGNCSRYSAALSSLRFRESVIFVPLTCAPSTTIQSAFSFPPENAAQRILSSTHANRNQAAAAATVTLLPATEKGGTHPNIRCTPPAASQNPANVDINLRE